LIQKSKKGNICAHLCLLSYGVMMLDNYTESVEQFESRKKDHIELSLDERTQATGLSCFDKVELIHDSLPELDFSEVSLLQDSFLGESQKAFYVAAMTAGHKEAEGINDRLAEACSKTGWAMMVGSQRRELFDINEKDAWKNIRSKNPNIKMLGNLGLSQINSISINQVKELVSSLKADALCIHCNPMQEVIQPEGTPQFKGSIAALRELSKALEVPIVLKETGSGFSKTSLKKIEGIGLAAIDVSGLGGTHWGRIEGLRAGENSKQQMAAEVFSNWGVSTVDSVINALNFHKNTEVWGSGGVRNGLDAAKLFALGASRVGMAKPLLEAAMKSTEDVIEWMESFEYQLKVALFCTGSKNLQEIKGKFVWKNK
jgi:isopentenyl-diphosphate delta-isomerase